jgi:NAD-dependent DNA ligase
MLQPDLEIAMELQKFLLGFGFNKMMKTFEKYLPEAHETLRKFKGLSVALLIRKLKCSPKAALQIMQFFKDHEFIDENNRLIETT